MIDTENICGLRIGERVCTVKGPHDAGKHWMEKIEFVFHEPEPEREESDPLLSILIGIWYGVLLGFCIACAYGAWQIASNTP